MSAYVLLHVFSLVTSFDWQIEDDSFKLRNAY